MAFRLDKDLWDALVRAVPEAQRHVAEPILHFLINQMNVRVITSNLKPRHIAQTSSQTVNVNSARRATHTDLIEYSCNQFCRPDCQKAFKKKGVV